jgi:cation diffusion facilitator family transporter
LFGSLNRKIAKVFIDNFDDVDNKHVRIRYGLVAGWISIAVILTLFAVKITLGLMADSISIIVTAFHLLSHLANSIILVASFVVTARPSTTKNPFGHGRMEHVTPLIMSIFLFVSGIQLGESSIHQVFSPHEVHYWDALPWILLGTIAAELWLSQFVSFLAKRVKSKTIIANAMHHKIEAVMTLAVIFGLIFGHYFHFSEIDGYVGVAVSLWLLYLGYDHAKEAITPLLGQAPSDDLITRIREVSKEVDGVYDTHEIIVHDYGSMNIISLHAEIPESLGPAKMHEITEKCEGRLRKVFGGEAVCHTDPLIEKTRETEALEEKFSEIVKEFPRVKSFHRFRVIYESPKTIIIASDINVDDDVKESDYVDISNSLQDEVKKKIPNVAYCAFYITPKFAY